MMIVEREAFLATVATALGAYVKTPTAAELEAWWYTCRDFSKDDVERVLRDHADDSEAGARAPRPIDVQRRLNAGTTEGAGCSARGAAGTCQYPGIFSDETHGSKTWWCAWHFRDRAGPEAERWIEVSLQVPYADALAKRRERMHGESIRSRGVVDTAHAIALRHGNKPWRPRDPGKEAPAVQPNEDADEVVDA